MNSILTTDQRRRAYSWQLLIGGLACIIVLVVYLLWSEYRNAIEDAERHGRNLVSIIEARLDATLRRTDTVLQGIQDMVTPDSMLQANVRHYRARFDADLSLRATNFPELSGLRVFDAAGQLLYANDRALHIGPAHVEDREHFIYLRDHPQAERFYSHAFKVRSTGHNGFAVSYPIRSKNGEFLGITLALVNLDYFQNLLEQLDNGPNGLIAIRRSDDFTLLLRRPPLPQEINKSIPESNPARLAMSSGLKEATLTFKAQTDGQRRIFSLRKLDNHPFYVLVAMAMDDVLAELYERTRQIAIVGLILAAMFVTVGIRLAESNRREMKMIANLEASAQRFRSLFHEAPIGHCLNRMSDGSFVEINIAFAEMTGYGLHELSTLSYWDLTPEKYAAQEALQLEALRSHGRYGPYEKEYRRKDGSLFAVRLNGTLYRSEDGEQLILSVVEDISDKKQAEDQLRLMASIFEHSGEAIIITDHDNRIVAINPAFTRLTGYSRDEVIGQNPRILSSGRTTAEEYFEMWRAIREDDFWQGEVWDRRKDGSCYPKWLTIAPLKMPDGTVTHYIGSFTDISERKAAEEQIRHLAHHDTLTGLPNRFHLKGRLEQALAMARRELTQLAVIFIDMDRFKVINDTLGHHVGDEMLIEVGRRLHQSVRASDVVARLGGDEFVVVLTDIDITAARQVADKILLNLARAYRIGEHELHSSPSLGIAIHPEDGDDVDTLMKNADTAMYYAKTAGRNNAQFYTASMNQEARARLALENSLRQAIELKQFELHYQPQIDMRTRRIVGCEALLRWRHPEQGLVPPDKFIPLAEETGLIVPLGEWVLTEATHQLAIWRAAGLDRLRIAINLSALQLRNPTIASSIAEALEIAGLPPQCLELEITESVAMEDPQATIDLLERLRTMGIDLAIDDFGTGYSSLSYLKLLPIQRLKLDRSFVRDIENDANDAAICSATIALAHSLGLGVVAEGVETETQREFLTRLGCDLSQGYLFSRPLPATEVEALLRADAAKA